jgi:transposase-like protein
MKANGYTPKTLTDAIRYYSDEDRCIAYMVSRRWPDGVSCPTCGSTAVIYLKNQRRWKCGNDHPRRQFSVKVGTIFEDSPLSLTKWLPAVWMLGNCKNGVSSLEIHRDLGVTQKTAWFMLHRIRAAMQRGTFEKMGGGGPVEADETFIGGKARNMHAWKRTAKIKGTGGSGKELVMGLLDRETGKVHVKHVAHRKRGTLQAEVKANVEPGAQLMTDELASYVGLDKEFVHEFVNHAESYVRGNVHTNGELLESVEAQFEGHLRQRRALPPVPVSRRAGVPLQRAQTGMWRRGPLRGYLVACGRQAAHLQATDR